MSLPSGVRLRTRGHFSQATEKRWSMNRSEKNGSPGTWPLLGVVPVLVQGTEAAVHKDTGW